MKKNAVVELNKQAIQKDRNISKELFKQYFKFQTFIDMQEVLYKSRNTYENQIQAGLIKNRLKKI